MGTGLAEGENRAVEAAQRAIASPLLEETSIKGAKGVLLNITATRNSLRLHEVDAAAKIIEEVAGPEDTIFGAVYDEAMGDRIKVTVIATGFNHGAAERSKQPNEYGRGNVVPLTMSSDSGKSIDSYVPSARSNLDEPAFKRRRAE
jgi:cell division protein FtsZ